jgi:2,4-dienoyl-CoA reductase (NADPH2)
MEKARMSCAVNAFTGRERELRPSPAVRVKRVVVVGSGPGGLETARLAARRGHRVALYEREGHLGGALVVAATVHPSNGPFLDFLLGEVRRLGVEVHLRTPLDADAIERLAPDAVVVATGGRVVAPRIPGDDLPHVRSSTALRAWITGRVQLAGGAPAPLWQRWGARSIGGPLQRLVQPRILRAAARVWMPVGRRVVVVGGDLAAIELAEFLAERGRHVVVLEPGPRIAAEVGPKRRGEHMDHLDRLGVGVHVGARIEAITRPGVRLRRADGGASLLPADSVILAGEVEADTQLYDAVRERVPEAFAVGDCTGLGLIRKAVEQAARAACSL